MKPKAQRGWWQAYLSVCSVLFLLSCGGGGGSDVDVDQPDTTPPTVINTFPAEGATDVWVNNVFRITFSKWMDSATLDTSSFFLKDSFGNSVHGTVACSDTAATFTPSSPLAVSSTYTARVTTAVKDLAGNAMASDHSWTFTTAAWPRPSTPTNLTAIPGAGIVTLSWNPEIQPPIEYNIYWDTSPGVTKNSGNKIYLGPFRGKYVHENLTGGTTYYYVITATLNGSESLESAEVSATPPFSTSITRYSADGVFSWQHGINGDVTGVALAALPDGSFYVTGNFYCSVTFGEGEPNETTLTQSTCIKASEGPIEMFLARYNADGSLAWARQTLNSFVREPKGLTVLSDGSVVVVGSYSSRSMTLGPGEPNQTVLASTGWSDVFVARYSVEGSLIWAKRAVVGAFQSNANEARAVTALSDDSVVLTGSFFKHITFNPDDPEPVILNTVTSCNTNDFDIFIARYTSDGAVAWAQRAGGCSWDEGLSIGALPGDEVVITGRFSGSATFGPGEANQTILTSDYSSTISYDLFLASYQSTVGSLQWATSAQSHDVNDMGVSICTTATNSLAVIGLLGGTTTFGRYEANQTTVSNSNAFLAKYYADDGTLDLAIGIVGDFMPSAAASAPEGAVTLVGSLTHTASFRSKNAPVLLFTTPYRDILLARYDSTGSLVWAKRVDRGPSISRSISTLPDGSMIVLGNKVSP